MSSHRRSYQTSPADDVPFFTVAHYKSPTATPTTYEFAAPPSNYKAPYIPKGVISKSPDHFAQQLLIKDQIVACGALKHSANHECAGTASMKIFSGSGQVIPDPLGQYDEGAGEALCSDILEPNLSPVRLAFGPSLPGESWWPPDDIISPSETSPINPYQLPKQSILPSDRGSYQQGMESAHQVYITGGSYEDQLSRNDVLPKQSVNFTISPPLAKSRKKIVDNSLQMSKPNAPNGSISSNGGFSRAVKVMVYEDATVSDAGELIFSAEKRLPCSNDGKMQLDLVSNATEKFIREEMRENNDQEKMLNKCLSTVTSTSSTPKQKQCSLGIIVDHKDCKNTDATLTLSLQPNSRVILNECLKGDCEQLPEKQCNDKKDTTDVLTNTFLVPPTKPQIPPKPTQQQIELASRLNSANDKILDVSRLTKAPVAQLRSFPIENTEFFKQAKLKLDEALYKVNRTKMKEGVCVSQTEHPQLTELDHIQCSEQMLLKEKLEQIQGEYPLEKPFKCISETERNLSDQQEELALELQAEPLNDTQQLELHLDILNDKDWQEHMLQKQQKIELDQRLVQQQPVEVVSQPYTLLSEHSPKCEFSQELPVQEQLNRCEEVRKADTCSPLLADGTQNQNLTLKSSKNEFCRMALTVELPVDDASQLFADADYKATDDKAESSVVYRNSVHEISILNGASKAHATGSKILSSVSGKASCVSGTSLNIVPASSNIARTLADSPRTPADVVPSRTSDSSSRISSDCVPRTPRSLRSRSREPSFSLELDYDQYPPTEEEYLKLLHAKIAEAHKRQLLPLKEDVADWLGTLLEVDGLTHLTLIDQLGTGVLLCRLADIVSNRAQHARQMGISTLEVPRLPYKTWDRARQGSFFARDNIANFLRFCRRLGVHDNLLFETEDLVNGSGARSVVLCLLEVGRLAQGWWGLEPPTIVKLEREIDGEECSARSDSGYSNTSTPRGSTLALHPPGSPAPHDAGTSPIRHHNSTVTATAAGTTHHQDSGGFKVPKGTTNGATTGRGCKPAPPPKPYFTKDAMATRPDSLPSNSIPRGWCGSKTTPSTPATTPTHTPRSRLPMARTPRPSGRSTPNTTPTTPTQCRRYLASSGKRSPSKIPCRSPARTPATSTSRTPSAVFATPIYSKGGRPPTTPVSTRGVCTRAKEDKQQQSRDLDNRVLAIARLTRSLCCCSDTACQRSHIKKLAEGKYDVYGKSVYVRLLKDRHVMVRVGGGWDTFEHYVLSHDPTQVTVFGSRGTEPFLHIRSRYRTPTPSRSVSQSMQHLANTRSDSPSDGGPRPQHNASYSGAMPQPDFDASLGFSQLLSDDGSSSELNDELAGSTEERVDTAMVSVTGCFSVDTEQQVQRTSNGTISDLKLPLSLLTESSLNNNFSNNILPTTTTDTTTTTGSSDTATTALLSPCPCEVVPPVGAVTESCPPDVLAASLKESRSSEERSPAAER